MARIVAVAVVAVMLAATPAGALAASGQSLLQDTVPQQAPAPAPAPAPTTPAPQQTEANSGSISRGDLVLIVLGIAALIGGIWVVIARDARRATAGRPRTADGGLGDGRGGSATRAARRSRRLSAEERRRRKRGRAH